MYPSCKIQFETKTAETPTAEPQTRLGGQPHWNTSPQWPLSIESEEQMLFLGQIRLEEQIFPASRDRMAYLFIDDVEPLYHEAIVIVLQPGALDQGDAYTHYKYVQAATGPVIYEIDEGRNTIRREQGYSIIATYEQEPVVAFSERYTQEDVLDYKTGYQFSHPELAGNKIGGQALYIESLSNAPEYFTSEEWVLLLQLAPKAGYYNGLKPNFYPFHMELGEFGILSIFIKKDYSVAKAYVQQP